MRNLPSILKSIFEGLTLSITVYKVDVVTADAKWKLWVRKTHYLNTSMRFSIGANQYTIESFENNTYLIVTGTVLPATGTFNISNPTFYHGKLEATNSELNSDNPITSNPFIWLIEPFERTNQERTSANDSDGNVRLFFMTNCEHGQLTDSYYNEQIIPMQNLIDEVIAAFRKSSDIGLIGQYSTVNHARLTTRETASTKVAAEKDPLSRVVAGVELNINLPIRKKFNC